MSGSRDVIGKVYLLGGGTGDVELLTLKGARVLKIADIIIFDRLVNPLFLLLAKKEAAFVYCGKSPSTHTLSQSDIEQVMIKQALSGKQVVRLKGGDPAVFGRVAEEMTALEQSDIPYEVIPGVTAASVAAIYAGIPLTHREHCGHVTLATGHRQLEADSFDYSRLVTEGTLAFYMGVERLADICQSLIEAGQSFDTPIAVITWGSYGRQQVVTGTLGTIMEKGGYVNPSMIIIGDVVRSRKASSWFEQLPYFGRRLLLVSQKEISWETVIEYTTQGADVWVIQLGKSSDSRFTEITTRYLNEHEWTELIYLDDEETTPVLLAEELTRLGHYRPGISQTNHTYT